MTTRTIDKPVSQNDLNIETARPTQLPGKTYKISTPLSPHPLYITINDIILNKGTPQEVRRPFEIFINSRDTDHYQWVMALAKVMSAVFRSGGDVAFLCDQLGAIFDPSGGYFKKGGKYVNSLVAEIGDTLKSHLDGLGMIEKTALSAHAQSILDEKRAAFEKKTEQERPLQH